MKNHKALASLAVLTRLRITICLVGTVMGMTAQGAIVGPYTNDYYTLHLWHFDEFGATPADSPTNALAFDASVNPQTSAITLSNTPGKVNYPTDSGYPPTEFALQGQPPYTNVPVPSLNFGYSIFTTNYGCLYPPFTVLSGTTYRYYNVTNLSDFINTNTGAFTFECLISSPYNPANLPGEMCLVNGDSGFGANHRAWGWDINANGKLEFQSSSGAPAGGKGWYASAQIPTSGADAAAANTWYHVAVTYTGNAPTNGDTARQLCFYWTLMDPTRTNDDLLLVTNQIIGITNSGNPVVCIGGNGRGNPLNNVGDANGFVGYIDEVRISDFCRSSNGVGNPYGMEFDTNVQILGVSLAPLPANTLVGYGQTLTINASEGGTQPITNQWFFNGVAIPGQTNTSLILSNVTFTANGNYQLFATNQVDSGSSAIASVTVGAAFNNLFNSGVDANGNILGPSNTGAIETHWQMIRSAYPGNIGPNAIVLGGAPNSSANGNDAVSGWIGPAIAGTTADANSGTYSYETEFQIDNTIISNAMLSGAILACGPNGLDTNYLILNGVTNAIVMGIDPLRNTAPFAFTATNGLQAGSNTLIYTMVADNSQGVPAGCFRLEMAGIGYALTNAPVITNQPASITNTYGNPSTFAVVALGEPPFFYQWYSNGIPLDPTAVPGANSSVLTLTVC